MFTSFGQATRRRFIEMCSLSSLGMTAFSWDTNAISPGSQSARSSRHIPVIDITDLYHPHQDVGDNFDLIAGYALPELDLKAVILDVTDDYRHLGTPPIRIPQVHAILASFP